MNTHTGYAKQALTDTSVLLAAGGSKPLGDIEVYSNKVNWGMYNGSVSSGITLTDAILDDFRGNKIAFIDPSCITVQYSTNGGSSWSDYELTDAQKVSLTTTPGGTAIYLGKVATTGTITPSNVANYKSRIYISSRNSSGNPKVYTDLKHILIYISTQGASGCTVKIDRQSVGDFNNRGSGTRYNTTESTWINVGTYNISGWSGWNSIPFSGAFGGGSTQTTNQAAVLRFTFSATGANTSSPSNCTVISMRFIGITNWTPASTMASSGHLYTYDTSQNAIFPAHVTATQFIGSLSGNATSATNATNDSDGHAINSTYLKLSGGTMTGSITFPDNVAGIIFRAGNAGYTTKLSYQTTGNEALVLSSYATVNSFIIANGVTSSISSSQWQSITSPGLQIKNNCVNIGALWGHGITPNYKLNVNGNTNISGDLIVTGDASVKSLTVTDSNNLFVQGNVTAASFIKSGGTASQVLMADGSVKTMSQIVSGGESTKYWANVAISSSSSTTTSPTFGSITTSGDLTLYNSSNGSTPFLNFRRATYTDTYDDWRIFANGSGFFIQRTSGSTTNWVNRLMLAPSASSGTNAAYLYSDDGTSDRIITKSMVVTSSDNGVTPKVINTNTATVTSAYYVLASSTGQNTPSWYKLPSTAFSSGQTYSVASTSNQGLSPKLALAATSGDGANKQVINSQANDYVLTYTSGTETMPKWRKLPSTAFNAGIHVVTTLPSSPVTGDVYFITSNA